MGFSLSLLWVALAASFLLALLSFLGLISKWPKIFIVSFISNLAVLGLYYSPNMYGYHYYLVNIVRTIPLILLLVHFAKKDPSPNWTYRAMCLVFIFQILTIAWHVFAELNSPYYDGLSTMSTVAELIILITGGFNARSVVLGRRPLGVAGVTDCSLWARRDQKGRV